MNIGKRSKVCTNKQLQAVFERAMKKSEERPIAVHACPFWSDPGGLKRKVVDELRDAMVIRKVVSEWLRMRVHIS